MIPLHGLSCRSPPQRQRCPSNTPNTTGIKIIERSVVCLIVCALLLSSSNINKSSGNRKSVLLHATAFVFQSSPSSSPLLHRHRSPRSIRNHCSRQRTIIPPEIRRLSHLSSTTATTNEDTQSPSSTTTHTIQILMSDTGGGHRASANALRDAFDELYPATGTGGGNTIQCDIVDIYTDYGPFFPFDSFVPIYQILQANPILWDIGFQFSATPFGLKFNEVMLEVSEYDFCMVSWL